MPNVKPVNILVELRMPKVRWLHAVWEVYRARCSMARLFCRIRVAWCIFYNYVAIVKRIYKKIFAQLSYHLGGKWRE